MGEVRNIYIISDRKPKRKRPLRLSGHRWEIKIKE
jgi:hypothetical protein